MMHWTPFEWGAFTACSWIIAFVYFHPIPRALPQDTDTLVGVAMKWFIRSCGVGHFLHPPMMYLGNPWGVIAPEMLTAGVSVWSAVVLTAAARGVSK